MKSGGAARFFKENYAILVLAAGIVVGGVCVALSMPALSGKGPKGQAAPTAGGASGSGSYSPAAAPELPVAVKVPSELAGAAGSFDFLAPEKFAFCTPEDPSKKSCGFPFPDSELDPEKRVCPRCRAKQPGGVAESFSLDVDGDGLPDAWEKENGLDPANKNDAASDADGDGFTALEEYAAHTDPRDAKSRPEYIDCIVKLEDVKDDPMPIYCKVAYTSGKVPRFKISARNGRDLDGADGGFEQGQEITYSKVVVKDDGTKRTESVSTGWKIVKFEKKTAVRKVAGRDKNVEEEYVTFQRTSDGKTKTVPVGAAGRNMPLESSCRIGFSKPSGGTFAKGFDGKEGVFEMTVKEGTSFTLYGEKFSVDKLGKDGVVIKGAGKERTLK